MTKNSKINGSIVLGLFVSLFVSSCNVDDIPASPDTSEPVGDYFPSALNNKWVLKDVETHDTLTITHTGFHTIDGVEYSKLLQGGNEFPLLSETDCELVSLKKENGVYTIKVPDRQGLNGYEYILLKDNVPVGATWSGSYQRIWIPIPEFGVAAVYNNVYKGTILEKNASITFNGKTYNNIIKVKLEFNNDTNTNYHGYLFWFSKGTGIVSISGLEGYGAMNLSNATLF